MIPEIGKVEKAMSKYWKCLVLSSLMGLLHTEHPETSPEKAPMQDRQTEI